MPKKGQPVIDGAKPEVLLDETHQQIEQLAQALAQSKEREKRLLADYQNLIKRVDHEKTQLVKFANESLLMQLLPILDNLDKVDEQLNDQGLQMVVAQIKHTLEQLGVQEMPVLGKSFDLNTMEAVEQNGEGAIVTGVVQKGYWYKQKVLIHAKVILGDASSTPSEHET